MLENTQRSLRDPVFSQVTADALCRNRIRACRALGFPVLGKVQEWLHDPRLFAGSCRSPAHRLQMKHLESCAILGAELSATEISQPRGILPSCRRRWANARTSFFWMVLIALMLRLGYILVAHTYRFKPLNDNFGFGYEMGRIGRSLALGQGFGSPFYGNTGPTAWEPPLYPFLIAGVFKIFGIYTRASALVLLSINSLFSAFSCIPMFFIARRCYGDRVAIWSSWAWALLPPIIFASTRYVWETSLAALLLAVIFWLTLVLEGKDGFIPWFVFGYLWGCAALTNTSLLTFLPVSGLWAWYRRALDHS